MGPYEHHSNILPWRESGAEVIEIEEAADGGPDMSQLTTALALCTAQGLTVAAFSAASNVTGICSNVDAITNRISNLLNSHLEGVVVATSMVPGTKKTI